MRGWRASGVPGATVRATTSSRISSRLSAQPWSTPPKSSASAARTGRGSPKTGNGLPTGTTTGAFRRETPRRYRRPSGNSASGRSPPEVLLPLQRMAQPTRRVVTGHDAKGKAVVLIDGAAPNAKLRTATGLVSTLLWATDESPAELSRSTDEADREIGVAPPPHGSIFRIVDFPPAADFGAVDNAAMLSEMGIAAGRGGARHAAMHRTKSIDYAVVISGEIDMLLDDSEVHLKAGDVLVQRGDEPRLGEPREGKLPHRFRADRCEGAGGALRC